ncbi:MAG: DinB family protein [Gemmatimonadales bacterium]
MRALASALGATLVAIACAVPLAAQTSSVRSAAAPPAGFRQTQLADLERERGMTIAMLDSMPERLIHFKPVPEVRDFMQQLAHAALFVADFAAHARGERMPTMGDSTIYLNARAPMRTVINRSYDYALRVVRGMSDADYAGSVMFYGAPTPRWKIIAAALEHSVWTRGELVGYFRLNGMVPPAFELFPRRMM